ncbi:putative cysteine proteinase inhibitor 7 [Momordica charantia]|uniref:Cysteine proteinase inhibitor 7 n=1 Tax=Momordica charantia TaxID=3673 RepID=A0A6J1DJB3_MOMCH|nr:putative cysteine proteinase inhibitor 7 [Momordica charantia]
MSSVAVPGQNDAVVHNVEQHKLGQWEPIKDVKDPYVQELGRFGVMEANKQSGGNLIFNRVDFGERKVVAGIEYRLRVVVEKPGDNGIYFYMILVLDNKLESTWKFLSIEPFLK